MKKTFLAVALAVLSATSIAAAPKNIQQSEVFDKLSEGRTGEYCDALLNVKLNVKGLQNIEYWTHGYCVNLSLVIASVAYNDLNSNHMDSVKALSPACRKVGRELLLKNPELVFQGGLDTDGIESEVGLRGIMELASDKFITGMAGTCKKLGVK